MKPDAHKRKKNAIYKKKHGIVTAKADKDNDKPGSNQDKPGSKQKTTGPRVVEVAEASKLDGKIRLKTAAEITDSDDEDDDELVPSQTFERRKLVCNWEQYEEIKPEPGEEPEDSEPEVDLEYMRSFPAKAIPDVPGKKDAFCMYADDPNLPSDQFLWSNGRRRSTEEPSNLLYHHQSKEDGRSCIIQLPMLNDDLDELKSVANEVVVQSNISTLDDDLVLNDLLSSPFKDLHKQPTGSSSGCTARCGVVTNTSDHTPNSAFDDSLMDGANHILKSVENICTSAGSKNFDKESSFVSSVGNKKYNNDDVQLKSLKVLLSTVDVNAVRSIPYSLVNNVHLPVQNGPSLSELESDLDILLAL